MKGLLSVYTTHSSNIPNGFDRNKAVYPKRGDGAYAVTQTVVIDGYSDVNVSQGMYGKGEDAYKFAELLKDKFKEHGLTGYVVLDLESGYHCVRVTDGIPPAATAKKQKNEAERALNLARIASRIHKNL
jgi:hypothetical protein